MLLLFSMSHRIDRLCRYIYCITFLIEQEKSNNTIISYLCSIIQFYSFLDGADITKDKLIEYKSKLISMYKPATVNAKICAVNDYLQFISSEHRLKCVKIHKKYPLKI